MRKERILLFLGIWVAILPYLGFPYSWKNILFSLSGLVIIYCSYILHREQTKKDAPESTFTDISKTNMFNKNDFTTNLTDDLDFNDEPR